ncbi:uncharacterized protein METZ01_LOCUS10233 [marine metagenome]|uniref:Uncharacterized protein n=1 Tax=marine metagenome TaxID=408172 RepID=A0A381NSV3_9ZZZZ
MHMAPRGSAPNSPSCPTLVGFLVENAPTASMKDNPTNTYVDHQWAGLGSHK